MIRYSLSRIASVLGAVPVLLLLFSLSSPWTLLGPSHLSAQVAVGGEALPATVLPIDPEAAPRPTARATRINGPMVIDGVLDEPSWEAGEPITGFIQALPDVGSPASERTVVQVLYDDEYVYIGAELFDSDPEGITAHFLNQDYETHDDDVFAVTLDTFLDRRDCFMFLVNPQGAVKDGQVFDNSRTTNLAWEGVIQLKTTIHDQGWTVELAIPFTTLRFDPNLKDQVWGVNFLRRLRRRNEDSYWAPLDRRSRIHTMALAGTLTGLSDLPRPRNLTIKPYGLTERSSGDLIEEADHGSSFDGGMDLKYGLTSRLTMDLTYRTDFSQVEVDQEQVNLTRFSLFFPEKRDFFIENSGIFAFGDLSERNYRLGASPRDFTLFHSRRIGLYEGRPVPILAGGRVTGRVGPFDVGLLQMQTESVEGRPAETFSVARFRTSLPGGVQVGGLFTNRNGLGSTEDLYNRSYGFDANLRVKDKLIVHSYLASSDYSGRDGSNRAARLSAAYRDRLWDVSTLYRQIGDGFHPGLGFVSRKGVKQSYGTLGAHPRPGIPGVNELNPYVEFDYITDLNSHLETRTGTAGLGVAFTDGGILDFSAADRLEVIDDVFLVAGQGEIQPGRYAFREGSLGYTSDASKSLSGEIRFSGGGFYDGDRTSLTVRGKWRPSPHFALDLGVERNQIDLPGDSFQADVFGARVDLAGSTRSFLSGYFQYNTASEDQVVNLRYNFIHSPLSDLFLVYSERRNGENNELLERSVALKVTKLLSF